MVYNISNEYKQRQTKYSFFYISNEANNKIDRPMLENSRASNSRVSIGVFSKFPKLKRSVLLIAGQRFIRWIRVIRSLSNLCLNCNPCISIFRACFELPPIWREKNFEQFVYKLISWNLLTSVLASYAKKILHLPNEMIPLMLRKLETFPNRRNTLIRFRSRRYTSWVKTQGNATEVTGNQSVIWEFEWSWNSIENNWRFEVQSCINKGKEGQN